MHGEHGGSAEVESHAAITCSNTGTNSSYDSCRLAHDDREELVGLAHAGMKEKAARCLNRLSVRSTPALLVLLCSHAGRAIDNGDRRVNLLKAEA